MVKINLDNCQRSFFEKINFATPFLDTARLKIKRGRIEKSVSLVSWKRKGLFYYYFFELFSYFSLISIFFTFSKRGCTTNFTQTYFECDFGCLQAVKCDPYVCAPEFQQCNCDDDDCDMEWCWRSANDGYCDQNVCRNQDGVIIEKRKPVTLSMFMYELLLLFWNTIFCYCCCRCCRSPDSEKNATQPIVND